MKNNSAGKRTAKIICVIVAILITALLMDGLIFVLWMKFIRPHKARITEYPKKPPIERIYKISVLQIPEEFEDDAIIAYMFDSNVSPYVFENVFGDDTLMINAERGSVRILEDSLMGVAETIDEDEFPKHIVIGLDPYSIYLQSCSSKELFEKNISFVTELAEEHSGCFFTINLPEDHADRWNNMTSTQIDDAKLSYSLLVKKFAECTNIAVYYYPLEEWVLYSRGIRSDKADGPLCAGINNTLLSRDVADIHLTYLLTENTVETRLDETIELARNYQETINSYSDLSGKKVIFIGDSVFGNYRDESAISSFFAEMTGAKTYNLGQGGVAGVRLTDGTEPSTTAFDYLTGETDRNTFDRVMADHPEYYSRSSYRLAAADLQGTKGEDTIFIVEFGLNDYFSAVDPEEYRNAITEIGTRLRTAYPESKVLFLAPGHTGLYTFGTEIVSPGGMPLQTYREITREAALESGCYCLSLANDFDFKFEDLYFYLLRDTVHYNESGRYQIAQHLARYF